MKIALYIEDGLEQIVLTPEGETEKRVLGMLHDGSREMSVVRGGFYFCHGGWMRESGEQISSMIVLRRREVEQTEDPGEPS